MAAGPHGFHVGGGPRTLVTRRRTSAGEPPHPDAVPMRSVRVDRRPGAAPVCRPRRERTPGALVGSQRHRRHCDRRGVTKKYVCRKINYDTTIVPQVCSCSTTSVFVDAGEDSGGNDYTLLSQSRQHDAHLRRLRYKQSEGLAVRLVRHESSERDVR